MKYVCEIDSYQKLAKTRARAWPGLGKISSATAQVNYPCRNQPFYKKQWPNLRSFQLLKVL